MNKLRVAIIEDEIPAARLLRSLVARLRPAWEIEVLPGSVEEAAQWFAGNPDPDLLFLDIQLADGTSFDLLSLVRPSSAVIFTTAYDEYAVRAFSVNSIDYILKPVDEERLAEAIARYETLRGRILRPDDYLETLLDALHRREKRFRTPVLLKESINQSFLKISRYVHGSSASARKCKTYRTFLILKLLIIKCNMIYL